MDTPAGTYELFDHTADLGIRVRAASRDAVVPAAVAGLYAAIGDVSAAAEDAGRPLRLEFAGGDGPELLRDLLAEVLRRFESEAAVLSDVAVECFEENRLVVRARRHALSPASTPSREVKAVTYHDLALQPTPAGWEFCCIVDI